MTHHSARPCPADQGTRCQALNQGAAKPWHHTFQGCVTPSMSRVRARPAVTLWRAKSSAVRFRVRHACLMNNRNARDRRAAALRAVLRDVQMAEHWQSRDPTPLIEVAVRRWTSFDRRAKPNKRTPERQIQDLLRGLREAQGDDIIYEEPGWLEHVAQRFGAALLMADRAGEAATEPDQRETTRESR
jgi:hypothetical protein